VCFPYCRDFKFDWTERIQAYNSGLLQEQAQNEAELRRQQAGQ